MNALIGLLLLSSIGTFASTQWAQWTHTRPIPLSITVSAFFASVSLILWAIILAKSKPKKRP